MKRILFVSISAPPKSGPESLQVKKYIEELSRYFVIDLVTTKSSAYGWNRNFGKSLDQFHERVDQVIELPGYTNRAFSRIKSFLPDTMKFPDSNFHFHLFPDKVIGQLKNEPDIIYSRSTPFSSAILAYKLADRIGCPWVMHLSDPWSDYLNGEKHNSWESKCFTRASSISVTTESYLKLLQSKYGLMKDKFFLSKNVFDEHSEYLRPTGKKLDIVYAGNLYGNRTPLPILDALNSLEPEFQKDITIRFFGNRDLRIERDILSYNLSCVELCPAVAYDKMNSIIRGAHLVLNLEDTSIETDLVLTLPSKVIDAMGQRKKILSIARPDAPSSRLIESLGGKVFDLSRKEEIQAYLIQAIKAVRKQEFDFFKPGEPDLSYSAQFQVQYLKEKMDSVMANKI